MLELELETTMTNEEYHANKALGATNIKDILKNPYAFKQGIKMKQTAAMVLGSATHCLVLEPHKFNNEFVIMPNVDGRTKEGKAIKAQFELDSIGKIIVTQSDYELSTTIAETVHKEVGMFFTGGIAEQPFFSTFDGVDVQCKPDYYLEDMGVIVDLKVCQDSSPDGFTKAIGNFGYYIQAAHYLRVLRSLGKNADKFLFIAVEKEEPFMIGLYEVDIASLDFGNSEIDRALDIFKRLDDFDQPIYKNTKYTDQIIQTLTVPSYVYYKTNSNL